MPKKDYSELEAHIIQLFLQDPSFRFEGTPYRVLLAGKPRPRGHGECKTDVYVLLQDQNRGLTREVKISVKTEGKQEFQENKITAERAAALWGPQWQAVVSMVSLALKDRFERQDLLYPHGYQHTKPNSITLGWKLEMANKPRELGAPLPLSDREIRDYIYKGTNQPEAKRNACLDGNVIPDSGVAEYLLVSSVFRLHSAADVLTQMQPIDTVTLDPMYLIFTANNYRTDANKSEVEKADGRRPLAVWIEWTCVQGKLHHCFHYDQPLLRTGGGDVAVLARQALTQLGCQDITDIDPRTDLACPEIYKA